MLEYDIIFLLHDPEKIDVFTKIDVNYRMLLIKIPMFQYICKAYVESFIRGARQTLVVLA